MYLKTEKTNKKLTLRQKLIIALGAVLCVLIILFASAYGVFLHYYNKMNITSDNDNTEIVTAIDYEDDELNENELTNEEREELNKFLDEVNSADEADSSEDADKETKVKKTDTKDVTNILLLGTDSRIAGNRRTRTDSMIILSIDKKNNRLVMTSVLRDTYVKIPGVGNNRLNAAFVYGGPNLLFKTFDTNFDIHLDKYVQVDFFNFVKLVDAVGGVDLKLTNAEINLMNKSYIPQINKLLKKNRNQDLVKINKSGKYHLNGVQTLAYSRIRYIGTDFGRTERQRVVIGEIIKKTKTLSVSELNDLADIVLPMISILYQQENSSS